MSQPTWQQAKNCHSPREVKGWGDSGSYFLDLEGSVGLELETPCGVRCGEGASLLSLH